MNGVAYPGMILELIKGLIEESTVPNSILYPTNKYVEGFSSPINDSLSVYFMGFKKLGMEKDI